LRSSLAIPAGANVRIKNINLFGNFSLGILLLCLSSSSFSEEVIETRAFSTHYFGASFTKTNPASFSQNLYSEGAASSAVQYKYFMRDEWMLALTAGFKSFIQPESSDVDFFAISFDSQRLYRVYHPTWIAVGFKSMYLIGVERAHIPYTRARDGAHQTGVGAVFSVIHQVGPEAIVHGSVERWRGTLDNKLHAIEFNVGVSFKVPSIF
jgi:hypothetical protein